MRLEIAHFVDKARIFIQTWHETMNELLLRLRVSQNVRTLYAKALWCIARRIMAIASKRGISFKWSHQVWILSRTHGHNLSLPFAWWGNEWPSWQRPSCLYRWWLRERNCRSWSAWRCSWGLEGPGCLSWTVACLLGSSFDTWTLDLNDQWNNFVPMFCLVSLLVCSTFSKNKMRKSERENSHLNVDEFAEVKLQMKLL